MQVVKRVLMVAVGLGIVAAIVWAMLPAPVVVETDVVSRGSMRVTIDEDGKTRLQERYTIFAPLTGRLLRIELEPGDEVFPNETLLAAIEPRDPDLLDPRAAAEAEARVRSARAAVKLSESRLRQAVTELELANVERIRIKAAAEQNAASVKELDEAQLVAELREEAVKAARFSLQIAEFELELAQAALLLTTSDNQLPRGSEPFQIRSPCKGRILRVFQESASIVNAGAPLLEVGDPSNLELVVDVLSRDAVRISPGDPVMIEHWGGEATLQGRVRLAEPAAYTKVSALGVEEQRVDVIVDLVEPHERWKALGDGYRIEARIVVWSGDDVLRVPAGATFRAEGDWAVFVVRDGRAELRRVELGRRNASHAEILKGLEDGDVVVLHPGDQISHGVSVQRIDVQSTNSVH